MNTRRTACRVELFWSVKNYIDEETEGRRSRERNSANTDSDPLVQIIIHILDIVVSGVDQYCVKNPLYVFLYLH